ncbi:MAG: hypothetical protein ABIW83_01505 [Allosphingosinicella sp.]
MTDRLPLQAETFLRQLDKALWPLSSEERETILLELRGHLIDRSAQGPEALATALCGLGSPKALAGEFALVGAGAGRRKAGLPSRDLILVASGRGQPAAFPRLSTAEVLLQVRSTLLASRNGLFAVGGVLLTTLTATNYLAWIHQLMPDSGVAAWPPMLLRTVALCLALAAGYRLILGEDRSPWTPSLSTLRFAGALSLVIGFTIAAVAGTTLLVSKLAASVTPTAVGGLKAGALLISLAGCSCAALRVQPWVAALAIERRDVTLRVSWTRTAGRLGDIVSGWAVLVLPLYVLHFILTFAALRLIPLGVGQLAFAGLDAIAATLCVLAALLVNATAFRWVAGEGTPAPRPFATEPPSDELVLQARARLDRLFEEGRRRRPRLNLPTD